MNINLTLIGQSVAMLVFVWFCMKFIWPPIMAALEERQAKVADGLAASEKAAAELAQAQTEAESVVADARQQAGQIRDQATQQANQIVAEARDEGIKERDRQIAAGQSELELQTNRAKEELRTKVAALAVNGAEKLLQREIDANAHKDLLDDLVREI